jgi:cell division septum initiation protein DivIVA
MPTKRKNAGEDPENESEHDDHEDHDEDDGDDGDDEVFTQDQLNALLTKENRRGRNKARREITEALGGRSPDDVKALLDKLDQQSQSEMTEAERVRAEADSRQKEADQAMERAASATLRAEILVALQTPEDGEPINPDRLRLAGDIALQRALDNDDEEDPEEAIAEAVEYVRKSSPEWFSSSTGDSSGGGTARPHGRTGRETQRRKVKKAGARTRAEDMLSRFAETSVDRRPFPTEN